MDASEALAIDGVEAFICGDDVIGDNHFGVAVMEEQILLRIGDTVTHVGHIIGTLAASQNSAAMTRLWAGVLVGTDAEAVRLAAQRVRITYEELPPVLSIEDAISVNSYLEPVGVVCRGTACLTCCQTRVLECGDVETALSSQSTAHVLTGMCVNWCGVQCSQLSSGVVRSGAQEHFYLEPFTCVCTCEEAYETVKIVASTQAASMTQRAVAQILGV